VNLPPHETSNPKPSTMKALPLLLAAALLGVSPAAMSDDELVKADAFLKIFDIPDQELDRLISIEAPPKVAIRIHFATDSAVIEGQRNLSQLDELGKALSSPAMRSRVFSIEGHTDKRGEAAYNLRLSQQRSQAVATYLVEKHGVDGNQLQPNGQGEYFLIDDGDSDEAHAKNRRVEILLNGRTE